MATESSFCSRCKPALELVSAKPISGHDLVNTRNPLWTTPYPELKQAAIAGCRICAGVYAYALNPHPLSNPRQTYLVGLSEQRRELISIECTLTRHGDAFQFVFWGPEEQLLGGDDRLGHPSYGYLIYQLFPASSVRHLGPLEPWGSSLRPPYRPLLQDWIMSCAQRHPECRVPNADKKWIPSRLIDVGTVEHSGYDPHLVITNKDPAVSQPPYVTLSHRWQENMPTLTINNLESLETRLPEALPKTFRDAILLTRELGLRYLWIDCLCILQDSTHDWRQESSVMGKIYSNCELNLAATWASDGGDGLFANYAETTDAPWLDITIECNWNTDERARFETYYLVRDTIWRSNVMDCELHGRGWVFPERLLSPRTVHFGKSGIFWECRHLQACTLRSKDSLSELSWAGAYMDRMGGSPKGPILKNWKADLIQKKAQYDSGTISLGGLYQQWDSVVTAYTSTGLTKCTDRLVALSGIAQSTQEILGDEYIAGLWRKTLVWDLCWSSTAPAAVMTSVSSQTSNPAPSWSWASIDATPHGVSRPFVAFPHEHHVVTEVIGVTLEPLGADATEPSISATLTLRGVILPLPAIGPEAAESSFPNSPGSFDMTRLISASTDIECRYDNYDLQTVTSDIFCLHLYVSNEGHIGFPGWFVLHGLLLRRTGADHDKYKRIGVFTLHLRDIVEYYLLLDSISRSKGEGAQFRLVRIV
ncbi:heterokaryon incompatibility protein-domain-containing protein [Cadophora sp. MPI-SDFR-AT-0126]|nr:heterokaryon incompatibility protein-domain-containing protein [Leotiomycetes sp. MPI-SDFR-AT-0126]